MKMKQCRRPASFSHLDDEKLYFGEISLLINKCYIFSLPLFCKKLVMKQPPFFNNFLVTFQLGKGIE